MKYPTHEDRERTARDTPALVVTVTLLAAYNITRTLWIPESWQLLTNVGMALLVGAIAWWSSVDATELGLHRDHHARAARAGWVAAARAAGIAAARAGRAHQAARL